MIYLNLVAFSMNNTTLQAGERFFKIGQSTGWTEGGAAPTITVLTLCNKL